ncbi:MAG: cytidine deaminase [Janthinobacterium lividum]
MNIEAREGDLIAAARAAALHAHAPYSRFAVGAALLMTDGSVVTGANVENASYGLSLCAETVAIATASSAGRLGDVVAVAVIGGAMDAAGRPTGTAPVGPCGRCRQVLNEAAQIGGRDLQVICAAAQGDAVERYRLSELLPHAFGPADLGIGGQVSGRAEPRGA